MSTPNAKKTQDVSLRQVMIRPKWILALILALAVGAAFASLAQWQMGSAVKLEATKLDSETVYPITEITATQEPVNEEAGGRMISFKGKLLSGDRFVVSNRVNFGELGYWLVGHAVSEDGKEHLAVALGWSSNLAEVEQMLQKNIELEGSEIVGRYGPQEGIDLPGAGERTDILKSISPAQLVNLWEPYEGQVYSGFVVIDEAAQGLQNIESIAPLPQEKINWLNLFYAIEWLVFAGFAVFFWYRLAKDAWEKEIELKALSQGAE